MKFMTTLARILLGAVFLYAAYDKILHPEAFSLIVQKYRILPPQFANLIAIFLPWLEAVCGLALVTGIKSRGAAFLVTLLMVVFIAALGFNFLRGLDVQCGCFGTDPAKGDARMDLIRDAAILLLAVIVLAAQSARKDRRSLL